MFQTFFYQPVYNLLVFFLNLFPNHDVGLAIILTTLFIKLCLLPLNLKAQKTQYVMKEMEGELKDLKEKYSKDTKTYTEKIMALYKQKEISPLSSVLLLLIQIPIFFALFFVFDSSIILEKNSIYSFIKFPENVNHLAFGFLDLSKAYISIGLITGISMFIYAKKQSETMKRISEVFKKKHQNIKNKSNIDKLALGGPESFAETFAKNMHIQMVYVFPVMSGFAAAYFPAALGIYWSTSNILSIFQDIYIKKKLDIEGFIKRNST